MGGLLKEKNKRNLNEIKVRLKEHKEELREKYGVKEIGIFGSYLHGKESTVSDIDILVEFNRSIDFFLFLELEEILSQIIDVKVDLVMKKALRPTIGKHILEEVVYV